MSPGRKASRDGNHGEIVKALEEVGAAVIDLAMVGGGVPDLYVEFLGRVVLMEVKNREARGRLNARQKQWRRKWRGRPPVEVWTREEALAAIGVTG